MMTLRGSEMMLNNHFVGGSKKMYRKSSWYLLEFDEIPPFKVFKFKNTNLRLKPCKSCDLHNLTFESEEEAFPDSKIKQKTKSLSPKVDSKEVISRKTVKRLKKNICQIAEVLIIWWSFLSFKKKLELLNRRKKIKNKPETRTSKVLIFELGHLCSLFVAKQRFDF